MSLFDVEHQDHAQRAILRALRSDRVHHAYLFHGPDGVGKERLALGVAELLLCAQTVERELSDKQSERIGPGPVQAACERCDDCRMVAAGTHPDLHLIYRQLGRDHPDPEVRKRKALDIGVDVLRHFVIEKVGRTPARGRAKVFIVREADRITTQAQNALLKTLEEPPGNTVLMLLVASLDRLLPTTLSRCQSVRFDALPTTFVRERLEKLLSQSSPEQLDWYARFGDGSLGQSIQNAEDELYDWNQRILEHLISLSACSDNAARTGGTRRGRASDPAAAASRQATRAKLAETWTEASKALGSHYRKRDPDITDTEASRRGLRAVFKLAAVFYADVLRATGGETANLVNVYWEDAIRKTADSTATGQLIRAVERIAEAERQLGLNVHTQLCVDTLLNDLVRLGRGKPLPASL